MISIDKFKQFSLIFKHDMVKNWKCIEFQSWNVVWSLRYLKFWNQTLCHIINLHNFLEAFIYLLCKNSIKVECITVIHRIQNHYGAQLSLVGPSEKRLLSGVLFLKKNLQNWLFSEGKLLVRNNRSCFFLFWLESSKLCYISMGSVFCMKTEN